MPLPWNLFTASKTASCELLRYWYVRTKYLLKLSGQTFDSKLVTIPKLCPAPRKAHQRSGLVFSLTRTGDPSAKTTFKLTIWSLVKPCLPCCNPCPPPRAGPRILTQLQVPEAIQYDSNQTRNVSEWFQPALWAYLLPNPGSRDYWLLRSCRRRLEIPRFSCQVWLESDSGFGDRSQCRWIGPHPWSGSGPDWLHKTRCCGDWRIAPSIS